MLRDEPVPAFRLTRMPGVDQAGADATATSVRPIWEVVDNENLKKLPNHLKQFIVDQQYDKYTPVDHAVWRYVMRQNFAFLIHHSHEAYREGLEKTGIGIERIPSVYEMNDILSKIGWACVTVDGFIPPAAFMEYQAYKVLVIAADMRQIDHIEYTPAPDIIHEAAGHAPIIADPLYAEYLRRIGEIGAKAMSSRKDYELYEAIRHLSILKELPQVDEAELQKAEQLVEFRQNNLGDPSEMALLSRLHWWTVEYGLVGTLDDPKIYGAGLLSSIGESSSCLTDEVKKLVYDLDTARYAFDITTKQPQLFVAQDFQALIDVLEEFAATMAFRTGGLSGLKKAIECANVSTAVYSSGLQVSGVFTEVKADDDKQPAYIRLTGPVSLAADHKQLPGHGKDYHAEGFGSPVGEISGLSGPLETMTDQELAKAGIATGELTELRYEHGVIVAGTLDKVTRANGKIVLFTFSDCTVKLGNTILFDPTWGMYDMAVGQTIDSVFCGAADKDAYDQVSLVANERTVKVEYDSATRALQGLYQHIRDYRESNQTDASIVNVYEKVTAEHSGDWLASLEILEILTSQSMYSDTADKIRSYLTTKAKNTPSLKKLISDGLNLVDNPVTSV